MNIHKQEIFRFSVVWWLYLRWDEWDAFPFCLMAGHLGSTSITLQNQTWTCFFKQIAVDSHWWFVMNFRGKNTHQLPLVIPDFSLVGHPQILDFPRLGLFVQCIVTSDALWKQVCHKWATKKKAPGCLWICWGTILPSCMGNITNHHKDPY